MPTVAGLLADASQQLEPVSASGRLDAELLLAQVLDTNMTWLKTWPDHDVNEQAMQRFNSLLARRLQGEPVAYILGTQPFWTLDLRVSPDTLIPRPETELLVETALAMAPSDQTLRVIDLGTGSGAIALALASERPHWQMTACDVSPGALRMAEQNRDALELSVVLLQSDWFAEIPPQRFDVIIANPPYIEAGDPHLEEGDLRFEPVSALVSGDDGLHDIRVIARDAAGYLANEGLLMLEHGYNQAPAVRHILEALGYVRVESRRDLAGHERVTLGFWPSGSGSAHRLREDEHAE